MAARKSIWSFIITSRTFYHNSFYTIGTAFIEFTLDQQAAGMNEHGRPLNVIRHTVEKGFYRSDVCWIDESPWKADSKLDVFWCSDHGSDRHGTFSIAEYSSVHSNVDLVRSRYTSIPLIDLYSRVYTGLAVYTLSLIQVCVYTHSSTKPNFFENHQREILNLLVSYSW